MEIARVAQEQTAFSQVAVASVSKTLTVKRGSVLHVYATCASGSAVTVDDNVNGSFGGALNNLTQGGRRLAQFSLEDVKSGLVTVTAHFAPNSTGGIWVEELVNITPPTAQTDGLDAFTAQAQAAPGLGANAVTSGNATVDKKPSLIVGLSLNTVGINSLQPGTDASSGQTFNSTTTGWDAGAGDTARSENLRITTTGAKAARFTAIVNNNFITMMADYTEAAQPAVAWVTQTNGGDKPFSASRVDKTTTPSGGTAFQTIDLGTFVSAAAAMAAVNQQLSRVLTWTQDVRADGVTSFTGV
jgi:hypothetical protein